MTAKEAKNRADKRIAERQEEKELYDKIQQKIEESADRGSYGVCLFIKGNSYDTVRNVMRTLELDGFECHLEDVGCKRIFVLWEHA